MMDIKKPGTANDSRPGGRQSGITQKKKAERQGDQIINFSSQRYVFSGQFRPSTLDAFPKRFARFSSLVCRISLLGPKQGVLVPPIEILVVELTFGDVNGVDRLFNLSVRGLVA